MKAKLQPTNTRTLRLGFGIVMILVALTAGFTYMANGHQNPSTATSGGASLGISPLLLSQLGAAVSPSTAEQTIGVNFTYPTYLPAGSTLNSTRARPDAVAIVYDNPSLASIPGFGSGQIIIQILRDNTTYQAPLTLSGSSQVTTSTVGMRIVQNGTTTTRSVPETVFSPDYQTVTIAGNPGWGYNPVTFSNGDQDSGNLEWWFDGVHYTINAELPLSTLVSIANSMASTSSSSAG